MNEDFIARASTAIKASRQAVWEALTSPNTEKNWKMMLERLKKYVEQ